MQRMAGFQRGAKTRESRHDLRQVDLHRRRGDDDHGFQPVRRRRANPKLFVQARRVRSPENDNEIRRGGSLHNSVAPLGVRQCQRWPLLGDGDTLKIALSIHSHGFEVLRLKQNADLPFQSDPNLDVARHALDHRELFEEILRLLRLSSNDQLLRNSAKGSPADWRSASTRSAASCIVLMLASSIAVREGFLVAMVGAPQPAVRIARALPSSRTSPRSRPRLPSSPQENQRRSCDSSGASVGAASAGARTK
jgi:hypothetical protein